MMILAPIAAMLIQFAISRQREFAADAVGAEISGRPISLANALLKLDAGAKRIPMHVSPAAAPMAQVNPLQAFDGGGIGKMFSTHPPTAERVARLQELATRPALACSLRWHLVWRSPRRLWGSNADALSL
jgi:heat shock protein HtpX